jgi:hypothetical protein
MRHAQPARAKYMIVSTHETDEKGKRHIRIAIGETN